jgi:hypothetical protein
MTTSDPFDIGAPKNHGGCHIGLYQPVLNCFLLTVNNIQHAQDIALISAGRYPLFMVNLVTADNYCENLIDNACCENWVLPDQQIAPTALRNYANFVVDADRLLEHHCEHDVSREKQYLQLCWYYLKLHDQILQTNTYGWKIKKFMSDIFDFELHPQDMPVESLKKQIVAELFRCKDINLTTTSIENIITKAKHDHDLVF